MKDLNLKNFEDEDVQLFENWLSQDFILKWYHEPEEWRREVRAHKDEFRWISHYIVVEKGRPVGFCQYYLYTDGGEDWNGSVPVEGTYSIDYLIGDEEYLGKGYGTRIVNLLIEKVFLQNDAERIIAQPEPGNSASCRTLLSCGFEYDAKNQLYCKERSL